MLVKNLTPFFHATTVTSRKPPQPEMVLVVRGTFALVRDSVVTAIASLDQGLISGETFHPEDQDRTGASEYPGDLADFKVNAEVMLRGHCHPGRTVSECPVRLSVGDWRKELMVFGDRVWRGGAFDSVSEPKPFDAMPLDFAHAFGGPGYDANPVGKGFKSDALPNVELVSERLTARGQERAPGSFGPISSNWAARRGRAGKNYGEVWSKTRAPFYADDFDWTSFHAAPADQQWKGYLRGNEEVRLQNLHPEHTVFATKLPSLRVRAFVKDKTGAFTEIAMSLDTLWVEPDEGTLKLVWRGLSPVRELDLSDVQTVLIASEALEDKPLPRADYAAQLEAFEKDPTGVLASMPPELSELWERREKERRGEPVVEPPADPKLDPVSNELKRSLGPLMSDEKLAQTSQAMKHLESVPESAAGSRPDLTKIAADLRADADGVVPPMRMAKPGRLPDPMLRPKMRALMAQTAKLREEEKRIGKPLDGLADVEAIPHDPRWKELDPDYEPPGPLSTDAPGPLADLRERDFSGANLAGANLAGANLERANLARANLKGANLRGAKLSRAILYRANLEGADLFGADLTLAHLAEVRASRADLREAYLTEAFLEDAVLESAKLDSTRAEYAIFERAKLPGASLRGSNLSHADFTGADLCDADLRSCTAELALFANARAERTDFEDSEFKQTSFVDAVLVRARLVGVKAPKAFFMRAELDEADLSFGDFRDAHFTEGSIKGARFYGTNLRGARFYRADLRGSHMMFANLMSVDARLANLERVNLSRASLYEAILVGAHGTGLDLTDAFVERVVRDP
ncbi:MAG: DUF2169 domain-containing protein [Polyangiaceae bacterium]